MFDLDKAALDRWITREHPEPDDFYEEDEPIGDVHAWWEAGEKGVTSDPAYVPTLLEYARVIEWMEDHPTGDSLPNKLRAPFTDALNRAALGRVAAAMSRSCDTENE